MTSGLISTSLSFGFFLKADVDHRDALRDADLRRGQADALRRIHALEHLLDEAVFSASSKTVTGAPACASTGSGYFTTWWIFTSVFCHRLFPSILIFADCVAI